MRHRHITPAEWRELLCQSHLRPTARLVGFVLSIYMQADGPGATATFPSIANLCLDTGLSATSVRGGLASLEDEGYVQRVQRPGPAKVTVWHARNPEAA